MLRIVPSIKEAVQCLCRGNRACARCDPEERYGGQRHKGGRAESTTLTDKPTQSMPETLHA